MLKKEESKKSGTTVAKKRGGPTGQGGGNGQPQDRSSTMLQGVMLLPDGKVLIMDSELYQQTIDRSIVVDMCASSSVEKDALMLEEIPTLPSNRPPI